MQLSLCTKQVSMPAQDEVTSTGNVQRRIKEVLYICLLEAGRNYRERNVVSLEAIRRKSCKKNSVSLVFSKLINFLLGEAKVISS